MWCIVEFNTEWRVNVVGACFYVFAEPEEKLIWPPWRPAVLPMKFHWSVTWLDNPESRSLTKTRWKQLQTARKCKIESCFYKISQPVKSKGFNLLSLCLLRTQGTVPLILENRPWLSNCCPIRYFVRYIYIYNSQTLWDWWICVFEETSENLLCIISSFNQTQRGKLWLKSKVIPVIFHSSLGHQVLLVNLILERTHPNKTFSSSSTMYLWLL